MKKISIVVPTYNEEENIRPLTEQILSTMARECPQYDLELLFIDNHSKDRSQQNIRELCASNPKIQAIFNTKNFGQANSPFHGLLSCTGDCAILVCDDFQDPIELLPQFVREWEKGYRIVIGRKTTSRESRLMYALRSLYYRLLNKFSDFEQIEHFTGFGLYDASFIATLRQLHDPTPFLRGIVAELGPDRKEIPYTQPKRRAGKTKNNFYRLYDLAMLSFTSYTKIGLRVAVFVGFICSILSLVVALIYLVLKLVNWYTFPMGQAPILLGVFVFGSLQLFFIGLIGEYIIAMNKRLMNRPLVVEAERINFDRPSVSSVAAAENAASGGSLPQEKCGDTSQECEA